MGNRLSHDAYFQLCEWIRNKAEMLIQNAPALTELSRMAGKELGFNLSDGSISQAIASTGVKYEPRVKTGGKARKDAAESIKALENRIGQLEADVAILRGTLRQAVGPLPGDPDYTKGIAIANGKR